MPIDKCSCCSVETKNCSPGCSCWEDCEVNEGYEYLDDKYICPPCEYQKGHKGKHLHTIGIQETPGIMTDMHPIWWEEGE